MSFEKFVSRNIEMMGFAADSIQLVLLIAGVAAFMAFIVGLVLESHNESQKPGLARRKPLLVPSVAFVITALLVITLFPIPMAQYHGLNEKRLYLYQDETITFRVYDGEIYSHEITIYASHYLDEGETLQIDIEVYLDDEMEYSNSLILIGPSAGGMVYGQVSIAVNPDSYKIDLDPAGLETISCIVAQPLADGMMPEILAWDSYMFLMLVGSFFLLLGGICVGKEERTRIRTEPYDQEPPRQGEVYTPRFKP
ncbi:MAG: hypothetical protein ACFFDR_13190 [Candidatus Thorarchaeota archaeon]